MQEQDLTSEQSTPDPSDPKYTGWQATNQELRAHGLPEIPWSEA